MTVVAADPVTDPRWRALATGPRRRPVHLAAVDRRGLRDLRLHRAGADRGRRRGRTGRRRRLGDGGRRPRPAAAQPAVLRPGRSRRCPTPPPGTLLFDDAERRRDGSVHPALPRRLPCGFRRPAATRSARRPGTAPRSTRTSTSCTGGSRAQSRRNIAAAARAGVRVEVRDDLEAVRDHARPARAAAQEQVPAARPAAGVLRADLAGVRRRTATATRCWRSSTTRSSRRRCSWSGTASSTTSSAPRSQEHLQLRPNDAIYWTGIRQGVERGLRLVDWGLSDLDQPGLVGFKRKWATEERRLLTLRSGTVERDAGTAEFGDALGGLTRLLTDEAVPDDVTARAGALLYRYFC